MRLRNILRAAVGAAALLAFVPAASAQSSPPKVDLSMNIFPTNLANPNGGGTFEVVAKTDSPFGIAGVSAYLKDVNLASITMEMGIGAITPFAGSFGGVINVVYGQDVASGPVVLGVGTLATSDGPDPLGDPTWNDATRLFIGTYSSVVPMFTTLGANTTDANTLSTNVGPPFNFGIDAVTTTVVRVEIPEPASIGLTITGMLGMIVVRRPR
jgi:hypothetical protein